MSMAKHRKAKAKARPVARKKAADQGASVRAGSEGQGARQGQH